MSLADSPLLGFDTETTGVHVRRDRIVTASLVRRTRADDRDDEVHNWLLDPGVPIPPTASAIHGITDAEARAHGEAPEGALEEVAAQLATALSAGVPVVAFNAPFDLAILDAELTRHGLATLPQRLGRAVRPVIDPLVLDRMLEPRRRGKRTLGALCAVYGVVDHGTLHASDADVVATLDVLDAILERHPELSAYDVEDLHERQVTEHAAWAKDFNRWLESRGRIPDADTAWPTPERPAPAPTEQPPAPTAGLW